MAQTEYTKEQKNRFAPRSDLAAFKVLRTLTDEIILLSHSLALLSWDQETYMPDAAIDERARQQGLLSTLIHQRISGEAMAKALNDLGVRDDQVLGDPALDLCWQDRRLLRFAHRAWARSSRIPEKLVARMSETTSLAQAQWVKSRKQGDFAGFLPWLEKLIDLKKEEASYIKPGAAVYDVLLDEYEPDMSASRVSAVFKNLQAELSPLLKEVLDKGLRNPLEGRRWPVAAQEALGSQIILDMGMPPDQSRVDLSAHPFSTTLGRYDTRITTRYSEEDPFVGLSSLIHESGHSLYELGSHPDLDAFLCGGTSLGIHESQSRFWENLIGRSRPFLHYYYSQFQKHFPKAMEGLGEEDLYKGINHVKSSFIRVDADELSYSLHVILRFNLEKALFDGSLKAKDLPAAWAAESKSLLGLVPRNDAEGVLQDIHWSMGSFGYFPTYALGNLYGAQFLEQVRKEMPDLDTRLEKGDFASLRSWLQVKIHAWGNALTPAELLKEVCDTELDHKPFVAYLKNKYTNLQ